MSLRFFHIVFIAASSALALLGGLWVLREGRPAAWAYASFACSLGLDAYLVWFVRKSRGLSS